MGRLITFNVTCLGASHVKNGKPCQDYSLSWHSDDNKTQIAIVCDGHGGDTYVRSDRGSRLAAEIALRNIQNLVNCVSPDLFLDKEGAVTARPEDEDDIFHSSKKTIVDPSSISDNDVEDSHVQQEIQNRKFYEAIESVREQDQVMQRLFASIYVQWMEAIKEDEKNDPFTEWEKGQLNGARIAKAYGTTLMAFVRTPLYWFAFHIGDGKLLCCDVNFKWCEPVPWDCNCFLNMTTSLCAHEPLHSFRYAFNGKGEFPVAVIMGSDGLDDSWCTMDNLKNFYSQVLCIFNDLKEEETIKEMSDYLPRLSEKGSRDDMSMAGIIDMDAIAGGASVYKKQKEINALFSERKKLEEGISRLEQNVKAAESELQQLHAKYEAEKKKEDEWLVKLSLHKTEMEAVGQQLLTRESLKAEAEKKLLDAKESYNDWIEEAKVKKTKLENDCKELLPVNLSYEAAEYSNWEQAKETYLKERKEVMKNMLSEKLANMMEHDEEAQKGIHDAKFEPETSENEDETNENEIPTEVSDCPDGGLAETQADLIEKTE